jgi:hypothetical protein
MVKEHHIARLVVSIPIASAVRGTIHNGQVAAINVRAHIDLSDNVYRLFALTYDANRVPDCRERRKKNQHANRY